MIAVLYALIATLALALAPSLKEVQTESGEEEIRLSPLSYILLMFMAAGIVAWFWVLWNNPHWSNPLPILQDLYEWYYRN